LKAVFSNCKKRGNQNGSAPLEVDLKSGEGHLDEYCEIPRSGRRQRLAALKSCGLWRDQWLLDTVLTLRLLLLPRETR
jgi:hypothetical protein